MDFKVGLVFDQIELAANAAIEKARDEEIMKVMKEAVRAGFLEMIKRVPVATGMSVASLLPIARFAGAVAAWQAKLATAGRLPGRPNRVSEGVTMGRPRNATNVVIKSGTGFVLNFSSQVVHYAFNDLIRRNYPNAQLPTPYLSFDVAELVIVEVLNKRIIGSLLRIIDRSLRGT